MSDESTGSGRPNGSEPGGSGSNGSSKGPRLRTKYMVFYHLVQRPDPCHPEIRGFEYEHDRVIEDPASLIKTLRGLAKEGKLPLKGDKIASIPWRRRAFLAIVLDSNKEVIDPNGGFEILLKQNGRNHSFDNITRIAFDDVSAVHCENHFRRLNGGTWNQGDTEEFQVKIELADRKGNRINCGHGLHNESGTNTGPPLN